MNTHTFSSSMAKRVAVSTVWATVLLGGAGQSDAEEVRILSAAMMKPIFSEVVPEFERASGHRLIIEYGTVGAVSKRVLAGERADLVIGTTLSMPALVKEGRIESGSD